LALALSRRPLELYGVPAFAKMSALVTLLCSRVALARVNDSRAPMTGQEIVELAARVGRTSQRMLFVRVASAVLISGMASRLALGLAQLLTVPLARAYLLGSLAFLTSEMRGWARWPQHVFSEARDDCCICMEALLPSEENLEPEPPASPPPRALVLARLQNGPQNRWYGKFEVVLEAVDVHGPDPAPRRSAATAAGEWTLVVSAGATYRLCLSDGTDSSVATFTIRVAAPGQPSEVLAADLQLRLDADGSLGAGEPARWSFCGRHRRDQRKDSRVELLVAPLHADAPTGEGAGAAPEGAQVLELPVRGPPPRPSPPPPPLPVAALRCGHAFHEPCIKAWLQRNTRCPLCRESVRGSARQAFQAVF